MQGSATPEQLPASVIKKVMTCFDDAVERLGPVRFEWVLDDHGVWIVQLHRGVTMTSGGTIFAGNTSVEHRFPVERGLDALRVFIDNLPPGKNHGVVLIGQIGVTSHFGDLLRQARVPSRLEASANQTPRP